MDFGPWVRRARREAQLSQREMATKVGISKSALARIESGEGEPSIATIFELLAVAGYFLIAVTPEGQLLRPFDVEGARDLGGRRFPAHRQVFRTMRGDFADYWWSLSRGDFFDVKPSDARDLPPRGRRRPQPRIRRTGYRSRDDRHRGS
jgi:transcriptional regulator with XRE-family HTH domain